MTQENVSPYGQQAHQSLNPDFALDGLPGQIDCLKTTVCLHVNYSTEKNYIHFCGSNDRILIMSLNV